MGVTMKTTLLRQCEWCAATEETIHRDHGDAPLPKQDWFSVSVAHTEGPSPSGQMPSGYGYVCEDCARRAARWIRCQQEEDPPQKKQGDEDG